MLSKSNHIEKEVFCLYKSVNADNLPDTDLLCKYMSSLCI